MDNNGAANRLEQARLLIFEAEALQRGVQVRTGQELAECFELADQSARDVGRARPDDRFLVDRNGALLGVLEREEEGFSFSAYSETGMASFREVQQVALLDGED